MSDAASDRVGEVWAALEPVTDPELDESVVGLGFIDSVAVEGASVTVGFRLPTFWCSANFAFIMAEDMRDALAQLRWVAHSRIHLVDHFAAEKINDGVARRRGFSEVFGAESADDLKTVRELFRRKAYLGRMSALIDALRQSGKDDADILALKVGGLAGTEGDLLLAKAARRFWSAAPSSGGSRRPRTCFRKPGRQLRFAGSAAALPAGNPHGRRGAEANGEMCRMLLKARREFPTPAGKVRQPLSLSYLRPPALPAGCRIRASMFWR
jgi:metal-sulfur cluster biosynthetic enzyme